MFRRVLLDTTYETLYHNQISGFRTYLEELSGVLSGERLSFGVLDGPAGLKVLLIADKDDCGLGRNSSDVVEHFMDQIKAVPIADTVNEHQAIRPADDLLHFFFVL